MGRNPLTDENITWIERKMDTKPLSIGVSQMESFFQETANIEWKSIDHIPGNSKVAYACLKGPRPMGMVKIEPGGYFKLHWHVETEHYLIVSGHGRFTIGTEERDIVADQFPTLITI